MIARSILLASTFVLALVGCGSNGAPTITAFTLNVTGTDAARNAITIQGTVSATDPEGDPITRLAISGSGPAPIPEQTLVVPSGVPTTNLPLQLALAGSAPKGEYTFTIKVFDESGQASAPATAKVTIQ